MKTKAHTKFHEHLHSIDKKLLKEMQLIAVAYSHVDREMFPTEDAYKAELEVEERSAEVEEEVRKLGLNVKRYPGDPYFLTNILVDKPDLVINLVDTVKGQDHLQTSVPAFLEFANIRFTGTGMTGLVIGNNRHIVKQLLTAHSIPTPKYKYVKDLRSNTPPDFEPPYIVKLNESGGSVGIDNNAVKETVQEVEEKVDKIFSEYKIPVLIEQFVGGPEITGVVFDDGRIKHVFLAQKVFNLKPDGKHDFTSLESYDDAKSYDYKFVPEEMEESLAALVGKAFDALKFKDYAKFDIRVGLEDNIPYFIDCNPNTAFGPDKGLPMTEVLALHDVSFQDILLSLICKHAKAIAKEK